MIHIGFIGDIQVNNMKKVIKILFVSLVLFCSNLYANDSISLKINRTDRLFLISEKKAIEYRRKVDKKNVFVDPDELNKNIYNIFIKNSPELYSNTRIHKVGLIRILIDKNIQKDYYTNLDIVFILYNLCIEDYIEIIDTTYSLYKKHLVKFKDWRLIVDQDYYISINLASNYKNPRLQKILTQIKNDIESGMVTIPHNNYGFIKEINKLISGEAWENNLRKDVEVSPPMLNPKDCK